MSYDTLRDLEQLRMMDHSIDDFIDRYNNSTGPIVGPRRTIFLFPGGLGSRLKQATAPYVDGMPDTQAFAYETVWLDIFTLLGNVLELRQTNVGGKRRDKDNRIIVADGVVKFLGCSPYDGFTAMCDANGLDCFVFGWDWRRSVDQVGAFFVKKFLPHFRQRVMDGCNNADALANFSLVGHSAGGMIANWILRKHDVAQLRRVITVATPFYGYGGQTHRWFEGEPYFNDLIGKDKIIKVITSMPGNYAYQFLPESVYAANQARLAADPNFPLAAYPSRDKATGVPADPYNPKVNGTLHRYPSKTASGFDTNELKKAKKLVKLLASDLAPAHAQKFFNIRGDTGAGNTVGSTTWDWVPPTVPTPIGNDPGVAGDGTQPAWTARHVGLANTLPGNVAAVAGTDVQHMLTMSSPTTLAVLKNWL